MAAKASPTTVKAYLDALPADRRKTVSAVRTVIKKNLPKGYAEGIQYGMIGYFVPHSVYPDGYHCDPSQPVPFVSIASQKNHIGLYLFCVYTDAKVQKSFVDNWKASGCKLDMGKSCVRIKTLADVPLEVLGKTIRGISVKSFIASYESSIPASRRPKKTAKKSAKKSAKKTAKKAAKKTAKKSSTRAKKKKMAGAR